MHIQYQLIPKHNTQITAHADSEGDAFTMYKNTIQSVFPHRVVYYC